MMRLLRRGLLLLATGPLLMAGSADAQVLHDGADPRRLDGLATTMEKRPAGVALDEASRRAEAEREKKQRLWIESRARR